MDLAGMRIQYEPGGPLHPAGLAADPVSQLRRWLEQAIAAGVSSANAMVVSSVDGAGRPEARFVLLRGLDDRGLTFFTNYQSPKARQLDGDSRASATFGWLELHRSVRVSGTARRLPEAESDAYFASRPRASQIGTWASSQSEVIENRETLLGRVAEREREFDGLAVPRPPGWGGYLLAAEVVEFWQGQPNRLHDRLRYRPAPEGGWIVERLSP